MEGQVVRAGFDFLGIYGFFDGLMPESLDWLAFLVAGFILAFAIINALVVSTAVYTWFERRALGKFQSRLGPNRWGPFGLLQPIADLVKFMSKEDTVPDGADRQVFTLAPIVFVATGFLVFAVIPLGSNDWLSRLNIGLVFIIAVTSVNTLAIFMAGWSSRNKYAMFGAMRGVAMLISYEVPMALAIAAVALASQSLSMYTVVTNQEVPFLLVMPLAFFIFVAAASAEMSRTPFDLIESESELGSGYHTEYSGMKFALFQLAEFMAPIIVSCIVATLFLSGWRGWGPIPGQIWFILKALIVLWVLLWFRATWPRLRVDQIMGFAWKGLFPLSLLNLFAVAIEIQLLRDPATGALTDGDMWAMAAINWAVTGLVFFAVSRMFARKQLLRPQPKPSPLANMRAEAE